MVQPAVPGAAPAVSPVVPAKRRPVIEPITDATLDEFAHLLTEHLNSARSPALWLADFRRAHRPESPNYGFALRDEGRLVGGIGALYAHRQVAGMPQRFCNITSWCVLRDYRQHSTRLAMALLGQGEMVYTDFSPTEVVAATLRFLKFVELDDSRSVAVNVPGWQAGWQVLTDPAAISARLQGEALQAYEDHRAYPWLQHLAVGRGTRWCHVIHRPSRVRKLPCALVQHVSDPAVFSEGFRSLATHWLAQGLLASSVECRFTTQPPWPSLVQPATNKKLVRSPTLPPAQVDYLYSESLAFDLL